MNFAKFLRALFLQNTFGGCSSESLTLFCRSSRPEVLCKKGVLRDSPKFTGKHLCQSLFFKSLFFNKVAGLATLLKQRLWHRYFPVNFVKLLGTPFYLQKILPVKKNPDVIPSVKLKFYRQNKSRSYSAGKT